MSFLKMLSVALTPTFDLLHRTPDHVEVSRDLKRRDIRHGEVKAANALTARGNVALSFRPVLGDSEFQKRKREMLKYDFAKSF